MAVKIDRAYSAAEMQGKLERLWELSSAKIESIRRDYDRAAGSPVYTKQGKYTSRAWTEWTKGFEYGSEILQFDATGEESFLLNARKSVVSDMSQHLTHVGVHDHGFNNISTYGNLFRLAHEGKIAADFWEKHFYALALKCSGAVQAARWTSLPDGLGYIYSFNGPHSLFADTMRSLRSLAVAHQLGQVLLGEGDEEISLLARLIAHAQTTARFIVYYGEGRDIYDVRGRAAHEAIFNIKNGSYRCPSSQQGYSPFSTWSRGLAWLICGFAEQLEFLSTREGAEFTAFGGKDEVIEELLRAGRAVSDFYLENTPTDGIPYWDTGAPRLHLLGAYLDEPADPYNAEEPVDSTAAAIAAQGLLRLGAFLNKRQDPSGGMYFQAGMTILHTLLDEPYLSTAEQHQGLLLHSVYHRPCGWDGVPTGRGVPCGESSMWGDYHLREASLYVHRLITKERYYQFFPTL